MSTHSRIVSVIHYFTLERMIWALIGVGFVIYANSLFNGFVMDDQGLILNNQNIHVFNILNFFRGSIFDFGGSLGGVYYRPLQSTLFSGIYSLFGQTAFFYHFIQVVLHIINSILLLLLFRKLISAKVAFVLSLIFLIHPMNVEAVSYIASMQDVLFFFFGLLYLLTLRNFTSVSYKTVFPYVFLLCGILSKESEVLFLPVGLVYLFFFQRKKFGLHLLFHGITFGIYLFLRIGIAGITISTTKEFAMMRLPLTERLINIPAILWYYLKTFFFPLDLIAVQSWIVSSLNWNGFFLPLLLVIGIFALLAFLSFQTYKKTKNFSVLLFFWTWFLVGLGLHMQFSPLDVTVADRYFYFPMVGVLGILGSYVSTRSKESFLKKHTFWEAPLFISLVLLLCLLSIRTIVRNADWKDTKTLALHDLQTQPDNYQLLSSLGAVYLGEKDYPHAIYYLNKSIAIYPFWGTSQYNLAVSYHMSGHIQEAKKYYNSTIANAPFYVNAYENMAILLLYKDSPQKTQQYTRESLKKFPYSVKMWHVLALAELKLGHDAASTEAAKMYYLLSNGK